MSNETPKYRVLPKRRDGLIEIVDTYSGTVVKRVKSTTGAALWILNNKES